MQKLKCLKKVLPHRFISVINLLCVCGKELLIGFTSVVVEYLIIVLVMYAAIYILMMAGVWTMVVVATVHFLA